MKSALLGRLVSEAQTDSMKNCRRDFAALPLLLCRPFKLPYATNRDGKISSLVMGSSIDSVSTTVSKQKSHFQQRQ